MLYVSQETCCIIGKHDNCSTQKQLCVRMKCPYLSSASKKKCVKMSAENMDEELSEFDMQHFCDGNPVYCYYFRTPSIQTTRRLSKNETPIEILPEDVPLSATMTQSTACKENGFRLWQE